MVYSEEIYGITGGCRVLQNMEELAFSMGHNVQTALENYVKVD